MIGDEARGVEQEKTPREAPLRGGVAEKQIDRVPEREQEEGSVGYRAEEVERRRSMHQEPFLQRHAHALRGDPEERELRPAHVASVHRLGAHPRSRPSFMAS